MSWLGNEVLDAALDYIDDNTTVLHICSAEPTVFGTLNSLGTKTPPIIDTPEPGDTSGRKVIVNSFSDGSVTGTGTATHYALVSGSVLIATGSLTSSQGVTSGNTFSLSEFTIGIPDPA